MKTIRLFQPVKNGFFPLALLFASVCAGFAQTAISNNPLPVVTMQATVSNANWSGLDGVFTIHRLGNPAPALNVYCCISGTASNGVDYQAISPFVSLPSGVMSNTVVIKPPGTGVASGLIKTVVLQLCDSPTAAPLNYSIGSPSNATVYIGPPGSNTPPTVTLVSPPNGAVYYGPTNISLIARASAPVTNVEFFSGASDLGRGIPVILDPPGLSGVTGLVYLLDWMNVPTNKYALTAVATGSNGMTSTSAVVDISVIAPPTNLPVVVRMVSPPNGSVFHAPVNLPLIAYTADPAGFITTVEFYAGTNDLGSGHRVTAVPPPVASGAVPPPPVPVASNYWELIWTNAPLGTNISLTALATANNGALMVSAPVLTSVLPSATPPTNLPVVNLIATDPVAIEGTNCWVWPGETNFPATWAVWPAAVTHLFTNCGPKTATFTVRRLGNTNDDLAVTYGIGGTASNGVDYVAIPGSVTIPAGETHGLITIVPIDAGPTNVAKTVILTLTPPTNQPPVYLTGSPSRAAAIILDSNGPRPVTSVLADRSFHMVATGPDAAWFSIQYSTDLSHWTPVCTNQVVNGSVDFVDPDAPANPIRYYRAVPVMNPPSE